MTTAKTNVIDFTNNTKTKHGIIFTTERFVRQSRKEVASGDYYGGDIMNNDYVTSNEFKEFKNHIDTRFNNVDQSIVNTKEVLTTEIKNATLALKDEINKEKITDSRFKKGIAIPSILSGISIIVSIILAIFF
ncbi:hypothetical protein AB6E71_05580 [Staphylococcus arlettae]|uniref:hypothetical protein n=1 Tax=Staphylococcus TaxID=1279 RepID=UPI001AEBF101|nr:hypothetical protein [Staphylococcus sp. GDY8P120P]